MLLRPHGSRLGAAESRVSCTVVSGAGHPQPALGFVATVRAATHSADVDYAELLPSLFELKAGNFYVSLAAELDRRRVLKIIKQYLKPEQRVFIGVVAPIDPKIDTPEEVRDRVLEAAEFVPADQLGTTDDCGFSPFSDDTSTSRDTAFAKIRSRILGSALAERVLTGNRP